MNNPVFISPGLDPDAWRVLLAARDIANYHTYVASRLPGYPVPELVFSLFTSGPVWLLISLTFLISLGGFLSYYKILEIIGIRDRLLLTFAFVCTPIVLINCFTTMDYMWSISFALFSFYLAAKRNTINSGIFLGFAIGCRITAVLMIVPLILLISSSTNELRTRRRESLLFLLAASIVGLLCYVPVISSYGLSFLTYSNGNAIRLARIAEVATIDTFGIVGTLAFLLALTLEAVRGKRPHNHGLPMRRQWQTICWVSVCLFGFLFAAMPLEAGYLIPFLPFLLLLARFHLSNDSFRILAIGLILSPIFLSVDTKDRPWSAPSSPVSIRTSIAGRSLAVDFLNGPLVLDFLKRNSQLSYAQSIVNWAQSRAQPAVLVTGVWMPPLEYLANQQLSRQAEERFQIRNVTMVGLLDDRAAVACRHAGLKVFYLPGQDRYNKEVYGIELKQLGGKELLINQSIP